MMKLMSTEQTTGASGTLGRGGRLNGDSLPMSGIAVSEFGGQDGIVGRELLSFEDFRIAAELYTRVFQYRSAEFSLNTNLLSALVKNGGSAVGVFDAEGALIGFSYGFAGREASGREFHYSQATTVDPQYQGRGIGKMLKHLQRGVAERWGYRTMRWAFDPLLARNARFNFNTLGACGVSYLADYYSRPGTDRILVEWSLDPAQDRYADLRSLRCPKLSQSDWGRTRVQNPDAVWVALPANSQDTEARDPELRSRLSRTLTELLQDGHVLVACDRADETTSAYLAVPARLDLGSDLKGKHA